MRRGLLGAALSGALIAAPTAGALASATPAVADAGITIQVNADFSWNGTRNCESQRPNSVICIAAQANVEGLGLVEYARDAVPNGEVTPDGCPEYSTHGTIWVAGGTAQFDGTPVPTCGADDDPDAHYSYTIHDGQGVLAGASGTGDVVADNGVDRWHGTIQLAAAAPSAPASAPAPSSASAAPATGSPAKRAATSGHSSSSGIVGGLIGAAVALGAGAAVVVRRLRRTPRRGAGG